MRRKSFRQLINKPVYVGQFLTVMDLIMSCILTVTLLWFMCVRGSMNLLLASLIAAVLDAVFMLLRVVEREMSGNMEHMSMILRQKIEALRNKKWDDPENSDIYQEQIDMLEDELRRLEEERRKESDDLGDD